MDVTDKGQQIRVLIAEDGFVAVFKEVAAAAVAAVVVLGVPGLLLSHNRRYALFPALEQHVGV